LKTNRLDEALNLIKEKELGAVEAAAIPEAGAFRNSLSLDRVIAIIAALPFVWLIYYRMVVQGIDLPRTAMVINYALLIVTMVIRRPPERVTTKPLYWATAFVATYWVFMTLSLMEPGVPIASTILTDSLALMSLAIAVFARLSLGRNIGFVPAQRELVTSGAYTIVRHPIYTGIFVSQAGVVLHSYSLRNFILMATGASFFIIKSFMEEDFLKQDPVYAQYMNRVPWRWMPFIA
jgi:protein-S-isoprenylcysteine O-methyltransferase Ste14